MMLKRTLRRLKNALTSSDLQTIEYQEALRLIKDKSSSDQYRASAVRDFTAHYPNAHARIAELKRLIARYRPDFDWSQL